MKPLALCAVLFVNDLATRQIFYLIQNLNDIFQSV